jgi:hypothetical protein
VKKAAMLHRGVMAVMSFGVLGLITAGCYDMPEHAPMVNAADFRPGIILEPTPITFIPPSGVPCPLGGFLFNPSLHFVVTAGVQDVTLNSVTIHMIDGSNLGGSSITIPQPELAARFGSTVILSTATRDFALRPDFGCIARVPTALRGSAVLVDQRGVPQTIVVQGRVQ